MIHLIVKAAFTVELCDHDFHSINIVLLNDFCVKAALAIENCVIGQSTWLLKIYFFKQSNCTPRCSQEVSASGLPWLKHFRVQCYTYLLVGLGNKVYCYLSTRPEVEGFRDQSFVVS